MAKQTLAEQVKKLETRVARLETRSDTPPESLGQSAAEFLETFSGIFENDPIFLEAMKLGAEWRASTRPKAKSSRRK